jgi:ectoine hydroxylase-related dioxygenase (phytanoyl-CoA dioxygenase family)
MARFALASDGLLPDRAVTAFAQDGFLSIERLIDDADVKRIARAYDEIIDAGSKVSTDRQLGGITRQVMVPSMHHAVMNDNAAIDAARRVVAQLFGTTTAARTYDMLIDKPAGHPHATPWHQDAGYFAKPVAEAGTPITFRSVQVWLALDDVDVDNGCMQFAPGRHREPVLAHRVASGDPHDEGRLIELIDPATQLDLTAIVAAPLRAGGATMHLAGTPHYTGPNVTSNRNRRAYIFNLDPSESAASPFEEKLRRGYVANIAESRAAGLRKTGRE